MNKVKIAIMAASIIVMTPMALAPILAEVSRAFPEAPVSSVQLIMVLPGLISLPFSLLAGRLATIIPKKLIVLGSITVMMAGGIIPLVFHESLAPLLISAMIVSAGQGFMIPITAALISDHFTGGERGHVMGLQSAIINIGGMVMAILSGLLAKIYWPNAYFIFFLLFPVIGVVALLLPSSAVVKPVAGNGFVLNRTIAYLSAVAFFFGMLCTTFSTNLAMYLDAARLGDSASAGLVTSLSTGAGIAGGLLFGRTFRIFKNFTLPIAVIFAAAGLFLTYVGGSLQMIFAGSLFLGLGFSTMMPLGIFLATHAATSEAAAMAIAVFTASVGLGSFVSPFLVNRLAELAGSGDERTRFMVAAVGLALLFSVTLVKEMGLKASSARANLQG